MSLRALSLPLFTVTLMLLTPSSGNHRQKRFVYFNHETDMTVGLLVGVPISVTLPSLLPGRSWGRSLGSGAGAPAIPEDVEAAADPSFPEQEEKVQSYFAHLQIPEGPCQERILCEIAASPEEYFPASEIFLKELDLGAGATALAPNSRLSRLLAASKTGFNQGERQCKKNYITCPVGADDAISRFGLKVWQYLASKLNLSFKN